MPRNHKRVPGSRHYQDYTTEKLNEAVKKVKEGRISGRAAEKNIGNKLKASTWGKLKGPPF